MPTTRDDGSARSNGEANDWRRLRRSNTNSSTRSWRRRKRFPLNATRQTLIFDEIDVGVGGRTGPVVGEKLWTVARAGHQVLCVTHMPQVAAFADAHFVVANARASLLNDEAQRVEELAATLAGTVTPASRE